MELRLRRDDRASLLLLTGLPDDAQRALDLLPPIPSGYPDQTVGNPNQNVREALLWANALLVTGERSEAQDWLSRAEAIVQAFHLDTTALDALAKRF